MLQHFAGVMDYGRIECPLVDSAWDGVDPLSWFLGLLQSCDLEMVY